MEDDKRSHPVAEVLTLFCEFSNDAPVALDHFAVEQRKDPEVLEIIEYAEDREVPVDPHRARRLVSEGSAHMAWLTTWTQRRRTVAVETNTGVCPFKPFCWSLLGTETVCLSAATLVVVSRCCQLCKVMYRDWKEDQATP